MAPPTWGITHNDPGLVISSSQRQLPDNTQYSQDTNIHAPGGFEPTTPESERPQTHALDHVATFFAYNPWFLFFLFQWHYSPLWALACRTISFHFSLSITKTFNLLTPSTWRSSFHPFLGLPLCLVPSSSWVKIFLGILSSSILSRWPNQLILCPLFPYSEQPKATYLQTTVIKNMDTVNGLK